MLGEVFQIWKGVRLVLSQTEGSVLDLEQGGARVLLNSWLALVSGPCSPGRSDSSTILPSPGSPLPSANSPTRSPVWLRMNFALEAAWSSLGTGWQQLERQPPRSLWPQNPPVPVQGLCPGCSPTSPPPASGPSTQEGPYTLNQGYR